MCMSDRKTACRHNYYHISPCSKKLRDLLRANFHSSGSNAQSLSAKQRSSLQSYTFNTRYYAILINFLSRWIQEMCHYKEGKKNNHQTKKTNQFTSISLQWHCQQWKLYTGRSLKDNTVVSLREHSSLNCAEKLVCHIALISGETR